MGTHHGPLENGHDQKIIDWNGFYLGGNGGWAWSSITNVQAPFGVSAIADILPQSGRNNLNGGLFGAQLGANKMINNWIIGLEGDIDGTGIGGTQQMLPQSLQASIGGGFPDFINLNSTNGFMIQNNIDWLASIRGRVGTTWHAAMLYFTAGGAWEKVSNKLLVNGAVATALWNISQTGNFSNTKGGYVVGAGLESMITQHWTVRGEYLYYDFSKTHNNQILFGNCNVPGCGVNASNSGNSINAVRLGVNYKI